MTALETQIHTLHEIWTDRPAASKPLAWLLQQLSSECNHQIALWSQAQTLQLSSAAKTIASTPHSIALKSHGFVPIDHYSRFASLCLALNEQCAQEKVHFIAAFDDQHTRHDKLVAAQATTLAFSANAHADSMALLQNTMTAKMEAAMDLHHADQQHWMDEIQAASHQHVETLKAMSVQAALDEDKLRVKMAEWEAKCASLVAEADMVLCETRAMHARELRGQQDAVALQLYDLEMLQMAQEERFLADTETFVRATDMTWRDRQLEQAAWTNQKQADLVALHIEHEGNVRQVQREHELKRDRLGEAVETIQMSHEERRHRWVATCDSVQNDIAEAKERHQVAVEAITLKHQASEAEHVQAMADRDVAWRELLAKFDTNATHESVQHARFMKQLVQRHHVEVQRVQDATIELEAALASQDAALMDRVRRWEDSFERLEVETQGRRQQVMDSHGNVLRDLDVAFEVQESTRRDERCRVDMQLCRQEAELRERASQQTMTFAMEMEDVRAKQWMQLSALVVVQDTRVTSTSDLVDSLRAEYDAKQRILDEQVEVLQVQCSDVERREIERHKQANQTHRDQMDGLRETWHEGLEQLMLSMEDERCRRMLQLERMHVHHEQALDTWNQAQELARQRILAQQRQHQRDVDAHLDAMQAAMDEVHFAHTTTMADIASHHSCILQDLRLLHAQAEEGWMQELEDSQRRQAWGYAQVAAQCADELWRGEQCIAVLHEAHAGAMATAQRELQIADETHEMWCMGVEDDSVRQLRQNELSLEAQWNDMQMDLNEREAQLHRQVQQLKAEADHDERSHEVTLQRAQEHWTEALSALSMEKEDVLSSHLSQLTLSTRALTLSLSQNQQAFYDEAAASIEIKWIETQAKHTAQLAMERESHARMFHLLAEAHAAQRRELASDKSALEQTLGAQLAAYERDLAVEMQAALRKLSIQDEKWQDEVMVDLDGGYRQMCAALAADAASQEAAFKKQLQDVQDQWRTELANIHLELQDISSHHMLSLEKCQALFERDLQCIAQKELEIDMRTHMERREAAERAAMAQAEKDGMEGRLRAIRYDLTQRQRQRHDEFDLVSRDFLQKTLDAHKDKERVRRRCLAELQALERLHTRDLRAQVPLGPVKNSIPKSDLEGQQKLVRSRIKEELVRSTGHLIEVEYASNMDMLESVHRAQANKLEMAMEDEQSRMWERRRRALAFLDEPPPKMPDVMLLSRPSSPSTHDMSDKCMAPSYLLPIELDVTRRALAKMQASMSSLEEMMRVADEKAKEDASVIQMLQDKAKSCVVELPTREVVASTFTVATKDTTNSSAPKANLLRGWK
ncbi:hypothetical protein B5M09_007267 [Aphanomyces astaci]|uniref:Uncharacterized protein n=1 Tax=Aphanomyces astaci TaxID=112090 RepID=A0A3R7WKX2_APHAT|nr:hypothetical protein B5M09_007267 [Aphanomyces astaci]